MKKTILLTVCLTVLGILGVNAQQSIVALHHEGKVTLYAGGATQAAMDASVKGDTLYLSEGMFGGFNVTHGIVVLGSGENTIVSGDITITGNSAKKDLDDYEFSGLNLLSAFVVNDSVKGFKMNQCKMKDFTVNNYKFMDDASITLSYISGSLTFPNSNTESYVYGFEVLNSKINSVKYGGGTLGAVVFLNCNVKEQFSAQGGTYNADNNFYYNCIVQNAEYATYVNCIYKNERLTKNRLNCWQINNWNFDANLNCSFTDEELISNGYIGTDGTVIGITGGVQPYTLELFRPHVTEHKIDVDNVNRTLKVTLKMSGETAQ